MRWHARRQEASVLLEQTASREKGRGAAPMGSVVGGKVLRRRSTKRAMARTARCASRDSERTCERFSAATFSSGRVTSRRSRRSPRKQKRGGVIAIAIAVVAAAAAAVVCRVSCQDRS